MITFGENDETIALSSINTEKEPLVGYIDKNGKLIFPHQKFLGHVWANEYDKGIVKVSIDDEWMSIYSYAGKNKTISASPILPKVKCIAETGSINDSINSVYHGGNKKFSNNIFINDKNEVKLIEYEDGKVFVSDIEIKPSHFNIINYNNILCSTNDGHANNEILISKDGEWEVMLDDETVDRINWDYHIPYEYFLGGILYNNLTEDSEGRKSLIYYDKNFDNNVHIKYSENDERIVNYLWRFLFTDAKYYLFCDVEFSDKTHGLFDIKREDIFLDEYSKIISHNNDESLYFWEYVLFFRNDNMYVLVPANDLVKAISGGTYVNLNNPEYREYAFADNEYTKINDEWYIRVREPYGKWGIINAHGDTVVEGYDKIGNLSEYESQKRIYAEKDKKIGYIILDKYDNGKFVVE